MVATLELFLLAAGEILIAVGDQTDADHRRKYQTLSLSSKAAASAVGAFRSKRKPRRGGARQR
jgi:hypothetical protein